MTANFSFKKKRRRQEREWNNIFKALTEKIVNLEFYTQRKYISKMKIN